MNGLHKMKTIETNKHNQMIRITTQLPRVAFALALLIATLACPRPARAANVMNYGADGNDYFQFTTPSLACDKASGFTTLITFAMHVNADGTLIIGGVACSNGVYLGPANWGSLIASLKTPPTTVTRYEVAIGGWEDTSYANIKSLVASQGTGTGSILYKNFQALKNAVPGIDAIDDDDELTYDLSSSTSFAQMLGTLGYKFTMVPYQNQSFWVSLKNNITDCDYVYVQCYEGGAGNDPGQWRTALGSGVTVIGGQESNTANPATFRSWYLENDVPGGFYYPDVVFNNPSWSAAIIEANGAVAAAPTGVTAASGGEQVSLSWNTDPGAVSYNVKRSTSSGGETTIASVSSGNAWPASSEYTDTGLTDGTTYYYEVSAVNNNGESANSAEVIAKPQASIVSNFGFETPSIGAGNYQYNPTGGTWAFNGASPNGSGLVANGSAFGNPNALQGTQAAFVQEAGSISQSVSGFTPGVHYTINFLAAERPGNAQSWNVTVDGTVIASFNPGSGATSFGDYTASFMASATSHTIAFVGTDLPGGDNTIFIDDVQITAMPTVTVPDLGFETPSIGSGNYQYNPSGASWTFSGAPPSGSGIVANGSGFGNPNAPEGVQAAFVQETGTISQAISGFAAGTTYQITFTAAQRSGGNQHGGESWNVTANGAVIASFNPGPGATTYVNYTATFTATASTETVAFAGTDWIGGDNTVFIDNVRIVAVPTVTVPDPGFETPSISNYQYNPVGVVWTFSSGGSNYCGLVSNGSGFNNPNAPEGVQAAFVQEYGTLSQALPGFVPGRTYTVTFSAAERSGANQHGGQSWNVKIDGTVIGSYNPGTIASNFVDYTASFVASATTHTLSFVGADLAGGDNTVFIDNVRITDPAPSVPSPWAVQNLGVTGAAASAGYNNTTFIVNGAGTNIAGVADSAGFLYQSSSGNCTNSVRVATLQNTGANANAKAGVMIRESLNANARAAGVWVTPTNGIVFTSRTTTGGATTTTSVSGLAAPYWVRITRNGNSFAGYYSADGVAWTQIGSTTTNSMSTSAYIGMGVDSGIANILNTATLDNVTTIP
jgi:hypothetical protein